MATLSETAANLAARDRKRSRFAMISGVALGLAALVITPKCVSPGADASASASLHSATITTPPMPALANPVVVAVAPAAAEPSAPAPEPAAAPPEASATAVVAPSSPSAPVARVSSTKPGQSMRKSLPPAPPAPPQLAIRSAHGGLSSPGF